MLKYEMREKMNNVDNYAIFDELIKNIIKNMDRKRGHQENLTAEEVKEKIYSIDQKKPGEYLEFMEEYEISNGELTPGLALEMADIIYYTSQPNCPSDIKNLRYELEEKLGIDDELAQQFCILKYNSRLKEPNDSKSYKKHEQKLMVDFFKTNLQK